MYDESILEIDENGNKSWKNTNGDLHRLDGPAMETFIGTKAWYQNGKCHRLDGPAKEWYDGDKEWWRYGKLHRLDGPAAEWRDGTKEWWRYGIQFTNKESFFDALTEEEKGLALLSEDFLNG
jgi:hypothetical protein